MVERKVWGLKFLGLKCLATITKAKKTPATIETLEISDLPVKSLVKQSPGICDTIVNVKYSNLNYKDALVSVYLSHLI